MLTCKEDHYGPIQGRMMITRLNCKASSGGGVTTAASRKISNQYGELNRTIPPSIAVFVSGQLTSSFSTVYNAKTRNSQPAGRAIIISAGIRPTTILTAMRGSCLIGIESSRDWIRGRPGNHMLSANEHDQPVQMRVGDHSEEDSDHTEPDHPVSLIRSFDQRFFS